jgi:UDP-N-acetylglucosamine 2-epimerase (non-hydrolysing)
MGTNTLLGLDPGRIGEVPALLAEVREREAQVPPLWDGHAAERIVDVLARFPFESPPSPARASAAPQAP